MRQATIKRFDGGTDIIDTYDINDFPYQLLDTKAITCKHKKKPKYYCHTFATFDIETTTIDGDAPYGFMYHWQMDIGGIVVTGRHWMQWVYFMNKIANIMKCDETRHFVVYIHNEGFEFQFMRNFLSKYMGGYKVFAAQKRKPIHVTTGNGIEFRCSWKLSNMSLAKATSNELGVVHCKADGDLDYKIIRTADTAIDDTEFGYCVSDVVSLYEYIECRLKNEHDNLESIPMTSTGYVRRDCRNACRKDQNYRKEFVKQTMTELVYTMLTEAGRGGDTHANRYLSGKIWHDADSFDVVSSYPAQMFLQKYPITKFTPYGEIDDMDEFNELLDKHACLFRCIFTGMHVRDPVAMPYISISKATARSHVSLDNGRLLTTIDGDDRGFVALTLTDVDYKLIKNQYDWDDISISDMHIATYGFLPEALLSQVMAYFVSKTELKDKIKETEKQLEMSPNDITLKETLANLNYLYGKSKNRLNGIFGMCYTNPVHTEIKINDKGEWVEEKPDIQKTLDKYFKSRNNFLVYAWGVWITAWARHHLAQLVEATGQETTIYCDTDSSKAIDVDLAKIENLNKEIMALADKRGAYCDCNGTRYYMGIYEHENKTPIKRFKTLGAKKYAYEDENGLHVTVSGVNKKLGATELENIENFRPDFVFKDAGGVTLYYNDTIDITEININGCKMLNGSNIAIVDSTYTLGITGEYAELIGYNVYYDIDKSQYT